MLTAHLNGINVHYTDQGPKDGPAIVFANSLGTDLRLWDPLLPHLPSGLRLIRYDKRGHGLSDCPDAPYAMGTLVRDAEALLDHLDIRDCVFVGLSIGGLIGQGLAVKRLDQIRALVLSNTAAKIGTQEMWQTRINAIREHGLASLCDAVMDRWFSRDFLNGPDIAPWRNMFLATRPEGYIGCSTAIAGSDFLSPTSGLRLPLLGIAGSEDGATPPDLVRETTDLIPGSRFELMRRAGHLPCVEDPRGYADILTGFLRDTGHL